MNVIDVVDTTVRDGEQTSGVSFKPEEKLIIVKHLLAEAGVTRCEVSSAKVSREEQNSLARIMDWAKSDGFADAVEVLSFTDFNKSVDWLLPTGCRHLNLLTKGSRKHCEIQLKKSQEEHLSDGICPRQRLCGKCLSGGLVKPYLEFAGLCMANA